MSGVTAANDWSKDRKFRTLSAVAKDRKVKVIRDGEQSLISIYDIVVGDVVFVSVGDVIPADGILVSGHCSHVIDPIVSQFYIDYIHTQVLLSMNLL